MPQTGQQPIKQTTGGMDWETALSPLTNLMKSTAKMKQDQIKLESEVAQEKLKQKLSFMYKMAEKDHVTPYEKMMGGIAQKEYPGVDMSAITGQKRIASGQEGQGAMTPGSAQQGQPGQAPQGEQGPSRMGVSFGQSGISLKPRGLKDMVENLYITKPNQEDWTKSERIMASQYRAMQSGDVSATQQRKESIQEKEALEILKRGTWFSESAGGQVPFKDRQEVMDYVIDNYDIDVTNPTIQEAISQYKPGEDESVTPERKGFLGMGASKATRQKYGYTYEKREDGQWHKIN